MPNTTKRVLPYPNATDAPNGAAQITALANALEAEYLDPLTPGNTTNVTLTESRVFKQGRVVVVNLGAVRTGTNLVSAGDLLLMTLAVGYRPVAQCWFTAYTSGTSNAVRINIATGGQVTANFVAANVPWNVNNSLTGTGVFLAA
jgi:DNA-binding transcriptional regulator YdaS (Cro superfamily)